MWSGARRTERDAPGPRGGAEAGSDRLGSPATRIGHLRRSCRDRARFIDNALLHDRHAVQPPARVDWLAALVLVGLYATSVEVRVTAIGGEPLDFSVPRLRTRLLDIFDDSTRSLLGLSAQGAEELADEALALLKAHPDLIRAAYFNFAAELGLAENGFTARSEASQAGSMLMLDVVRGRLATWSEPLRRSA